MRQLPKRALVLARRLPARLHRAAQQLDQLAAAPCPPARRGALHAAAARCPLPSAAATRPLASSQLASTAHPCTTLAAALVLLLQLLLQPAAAQVCRDQLLAAAPDARGVEGWIDADSPVEACTKRLDGFDADYQVRERWRRVLALLRGKEGRLAMREPHDRGPCTQLKPPCLPAHVLSPPQLVFSDEFNSAPGDRNLK